MWRWLFAVAVAVAVSRRGLRKGSLSRSGALAALVVGSFALGTAAFTGAVLLAFYFSGSAATRCKQELKEKIDLEHRTGGGQRNWQQVLATAGIGCLLLLPALIRSDLSPFLGWPVPSFASQPWALVLPAAPMVVSLQHSFVSAFQGLSGEILIGQCLVAYVASFATVAGDTWASELGVLSSHPPVLITDFFCGRGCSPRRVPRGTNGGVSAWGTLMSAAGGAFVGCIAAIVLALQGLLAAAVFGGSESETALAHAAADAFALRPHVVAGGAALVLPPLWLVPLSCFAGLLGSFIDSVAGALLQRSWVQRSSGKATSRLPPGATVLCDASGSPLRLSDREMEELAQAPFAAALAARKVGTPSHPSQSGDAVKSDLPLADGLRQRKPAGGSNAATVADVAPIAAANPEVATLGKDAGFLVVCGYDLVSNEAVNFLASAVTAGLTAWIATLTARAAAA